MQPKLLVGLIPGSRFAALAASRTIYWMFWDNTGVVGSGRAQGNVGEGSQKILRSHLKTIPPSKRKFENLLMKQGSEFDSFWRGYIPSMY
jgi:hypothetical protein